MACGGLIHRAVLPSCSGHLRTALKQRCGIAPRCPSHGSRQPACISLCLLFSAPAAFLQRPSSAFGHRVSHPSHRRLNSLSAH